MNYDKIGKFIKEKRKEKGLTQNELASKINVTDKAISKWERGLGCPDVSLLEVLSKELDVSILELLNGRKIESEVIKVTEADDYIKNTINISNDYTKNKIKNIFNRIIEVSILFIVLLLILLNVVQYKYMDKEYTYRITRDTYNTITDTLNSIEENINIIKNNKTIFNEEDKQIIINNLEEDNNKINNIYYLKKIKDLKPITYKVNDLRLLTDMFYNPNNEVDILNILDKYVDSNLIKIYTDYSIRNLSNTARSSGLYNKVLESYYYSLSYNNQSIASTRISDLSELNSNLETRVRQFLFLTELVKEVGVIND
jgi:transcriptional regulator with XRE-family HTH domain